MNGMNRRQFLLAANAAMAFAGESARAAAEAPALKDLAGKAGMLFGAAVINRMFQDPAARDAILRQCSLLTSTGEMKWDALRPAPGQFNFAGADAFMAFADQNKIAVHGHTLVWYQALPSWFNSEVNRSNAARTLEDHIKAVMGRYRSKIRFWDVVNEVIDPKSSRPGMLRDSAWLRLAGADYIERAFRAARAADPAATLVWNEDDMESDNDYSRKKRRAVLDLLGRLKKENVPVDAFGLQAHLKPEFHKDNRDYLDFLKALKDTGVKLLITELDVIDTNIPPAGRDNDVASLYYDFVSSTCRVFKPISIQVWELSDQRNWMDVSMPSWRRADGLPHRPAILDDTYAPKPAFAKLQQALREIS